MFTSKELVDHLDLDKVEDGLFKGENISVGSPNVFGGQVLAQAINAAYKTINNGRVLNSMHSYFLEAGNLEKPILYNVDIMRDGGSFSVRRVTALQDDKTIFILSCSFHKEEQGYAHQIEMPVVEKQPEELLSWTDMYEQFGHMLPKFTQEFLKLERPIDVKPVDVPNPFEKKDLATTTNVWFKLKGDSRHLDLAAKQQILTYVSDYNILSVALYRHASKAHWGNTFTASLDHAMWYFRDFDFDDWMLYALDTPSTQNARGFCRGHIFSRKGDLIASVTQEGLMRPKS